MGTTVIKRRKVNTEPIYGAGTLKSYIHYIRVNNTKHYLKIGGTSYPAGALEVKIDKITGNIKQKDGLYLSDYVVIDGQRYYLHW